MKYYWPSVVSQRSPLERIITMKRSLCILLIIATIFVLPSVAMAIDCPDGVVISIKIDFNFQFRELRHWSTYGSFWGPWTDVTGPMEIIRKRPLDIQFRIGEGRGGTPSTPALYDREIQSCRYALTGEKEKLRLFLMPE